MTAEQDLAAELARLREGIDAIDRSLAEKLNERAHFVAQVGAIKSQAKRAVYDPTREANVVNNALQWLNAQPGASIPASSLRRIFNVLMQESRAWQTSRTVAYLGPEGTHSHQAAIEAFGAATTLMPMPGFDHIHRAMVNGQVAYGILPIENSIEGPIGQNLDLLARNDVVIVGEVTLPVRNVILTAVETVDLRTVKYVYSHPQPLGQCRKWLAANMPQAQQIATNSTVSEIGALAGRGDIAKTDWAVIAGRHAADVYGLKVAATDVSDAPTNSTLFVVIRLREAAIADGSDHRLFPNAKGERKGLKTTMVVTVPHAPGSLFRALQPIAEAGVNMLRIQSRPVADHPWEYVFFVEIEGSTEDSAVTAMLQQLQSRTVSVKLLGSYPSIDLSHLRA